jgi:hypothetical protein
MAQQMSEELARVHEERRQADPRRMDTPVTRKTVNRFAVSAQKDVDVLSSKVRIYRDKRVAHWDQGEVELPNTDLREIRDMIDHFWSILNKLEYWLRDRGIDGSGVYRQVHRSITYTLCRSWVMEELLLAARSSETQSAVGVLRTKLAQVEAASEKSVGKHS